MVVGGDATSVRKILPLIIYVFDTPEWSPPPTPPPAGDTSFIFLRFAGKMNEDICRYLFLFHALTANDCLQCFNIRRKG